MEDKQELFYVQNVQRGEVGNCVQWWRKNGQGYCCNIDEAEVFSKKDAQELMSHSSRKYEVWPCKTINQICKKHIDCQDLAKFDKVNIQGGE